MTKWSIAVGLALGVLIAAGVLLLARKQGVAEPPSGPPVAGDAHLQDVEIQLSPRGEI